MYIVEEFPRLFSIETSGKTFETPFFFPSISTIKADLSILKYFDLIKKVGYNGFLISAYDILKSEKKGILLKNISDSTKNTIFFLDNGMYEAFWYNDKNWKFEDFKSILEKVSPDLCFSFDVFWNDDKNKEKHIEETITNIAKTASIQKTGSTVPIIHSTPKLFSYMTRKIVDYINPEIVAVPERELGSDIIERCQTIKTIRNELNKTNRKIPIHILGTGNPISMLIYTLCGADMYDGLEWFNIVINPKDGQILNFSQRNLIDCSCKACKSEEIPYYLGALTHNLIFYTEFLEKIRFALKNKETDSILHEYLSEKTAKMVKKIMGFE